MEFKHQPVLLAQTLACLQPRAGGLYVDGTLGGGGHTAAILQASGPDGQVIGIDQDQEALQAAGRRLQAYGERFRPVQANFAEMPRVLAALNIREVDGVLLDIGVSSYQLDEAARGFSYMQDGPLDMRMNRQTGQTAAQLLAGLSETQLADIIWRYGEERFARRIAQRIVKEREKQPIIRTAQLAEVIAAAIPAAQRRKEKQHPAKRTFQALRIAVNDELKVLESGLAAAFASLRSGGRLVVISFHSLEDRIVKGFFGEQARGCVCPPEFPVCVCGHKPQARLLNRRPLTAEAEELAANPRARSARLRALEKL